MIKKSLILAAISLASGVSAASAQYAGYGSQGDPSMYGYGNPQQQMPQQGGGQVQMVRGSHFTFALPAGWQVGEEGQQALVINSPDGAASVIVFGVSGLGGGVSPEQF